MSAAPSVGKPGVSRRVPRVDLPLMAAVLALLSIGTIAVFTATAPLAATQGQSPYSAAIQQVAWAGIGLGMMGVLSRVPYARWRRWSRPILTGTVLLLLLVFVPHVGMRVNGARRWLHFGPLTGQPSSIAIVALAVFLAHRLARDHAAIHDLRPGVLRPLALASPVIGLILLEPDLGTATVAGGMVLVLLWVAGVRLRHFAAVVGIGAAAFVGKVWLGGSDRGRVLAFFNPWRDPHGTGYQAIQALLALGTGGIFGLGLGYSPQAMGYLPEASSDYIFATWGQQTGLIGTLTVVLLFLVVAWRGLRIAWRAPDRFGQLLGAGLTATILLPAMLNISVATATLPVTGVPLPFMSAGGSALVANLISVGLLLNISRTRGALPH